MTMSSSRKKTIGVSAVLLALGAVIVLPNFIRVRTVSAAAPCTHFLMVIDGAKQQWALEFPGRTNEVPTFDDLRPYIKWDSTNYPKCPEGGVYSWGKVGERPRCSLGGNGHSCPW